jgi:uncharacterized protein (DUF608 family)
LTLTLTENCCQPGQVKQKLGSHNIPADKNLSDAWVTSLYSKGSSKVYRGEELACIGMPIGGICAGQLYIRGDGTLAEWGIFNHPHFTGYGETSYRTYTPPSPVEHGFGIWLRHKGGKPIYRSLSKTGFPNVEFVGEYPIAKVHYTPDGDSGLPIDISLEAFSPFVPLNARESATPGTILDFKVTNNSPDEVEVALGGWLQNVIGSRHAGKIRGFGQNRIVHSAPISSQAPGAGGAPAMTTLLMDAHESPAPTQSRQLRPPEVFEDFESGTYAKWQKTGSAFGAGPAAGTLPHQQPVTGFGGKFLVNSFSGGDDSTGTLTSKPFVIRRAYIRFRIGGGERPGQACMNLLVANKVVRTATGKNSERLEWDYWEVSDLEGKEAVIQIRDDAKGGWGHINVDDIQFSDTLPAGVKQAHWKDQVDFGTLALSVLDVPPGKTTGSVTGFDRFHAEGGFETSPAPAEFPLGQSNIGALAMHFQLRPAESRSVVFFLTWHFAGSEHGRAYGEWYQDALDVARHLQKHLQRLTSLTRLFHDTYYDSTLPHWLLDRIVMPVSTLATNTVQWWRNGRFWAWEGVGCCEGTCTHVWNYAQGMAKLFPELERSARVMQDLGPALDPKTGRVGFRGEDPRSPYAADGQCGTVLKCYREHLMSKDGSFLKEHWPNIKKAMEYAIARDGNDDGILEDKQWNTFDLNFVGPNTFVGSLYLAALEAAARIADLEGDPQFGERCRQIARKGSQWSSRNLWNGEFFTQRIPPGSSPKYQYGEGCLADQLFGQNWANLTGLGYLYPREQVQNALKAIYRYNWAPDIAAQNQAYPPQRWFARPGEAGLFTCTWPRGGRMAEPVLYRDEVWTGSEYQVASHLLYEGMIREGLSIIRGIHDRYNGRQHNPWNEVECGDHYARALASWGCLLNLCAFRHDGPAGRLGFAPRWQADNFKAFFTTAEAWGTLGQKRSGRTQVNFVNRRHGRLRLRELTFEVPERAIVRQTKLSVGASEVRCHTRQQGSEITLTILEQILLDEPGASDLHVEFNW